MQNNYYNGEEEFSCDVQLDNSIFKNKEMTKLYNQVLDGHKITMISKLLFTINKDFVYSRNNWYFFTGSIWRCDNDNIEMKKSIIDLSKMFDKIKTHYDTKFTDETTINLNKNIKSLSIIHLLNYFNLRIIKYDHCYWTKPRTWLI